MPADRAQVLFRLEGGEERELLERQRHLVERLLVVGRARVSRVQAAHALFDAAPGLHPPDALQDHVGRAEAQRDRFRRLGRLGEVVEPLRPLERGIDDLLRLFHHGLDQRARVERALLDQDRAQPLALADGAPRGHVLVQGDAALAQQHLAQPVVAARRMGEHEPAFLHAHALLDAHVVQGEKAAPAPRVDLAHDVGELVVGQPAARPRDGVARPRARPQRAAPGGCGGRHGRGDRRPEPAAAAAGAPVERGWRQARERPSPRRGPAAGRAGGAGAALAGAGFAGPPALGAAAGAEPASPRAAASRRRHPRRARSRTAR